ncbi:MAG TPA: hypothetical protein VNS63_21625 [Blastocatellia bacterium]|nr:hypothetical protein [Blastocatellia bacterium]
MTRDLFAREALSHIPKLLTLLDRNPHSPTYGCFDRNFWHYKIIDFPSGMSQEFVWPLALAYDTEIPKNPYYHEHTIKEWAEAGILYAAKSAHSDGSCDDYFPFERAGGAAAFSLLACVESYSILKLENKIALEFFERRADWLAGHNESGRLSNHQALSVVCLELVSRILNTNRWDKAKAARLDRVLSWQSEEGWFWEYEGCDPGYHTLTVWCLARLYQLDPSRKLKNALTMAVRLAAEFVHPDGSYGGEYGSRNTYNFFPHGFELVGSWLPEALSINNCFLEGLARGLAPCYADDHIIGHHAWNYLLAWRDFVLDRTTTRQSRESIWLKRAGILIDRRAGTELYIALNKGGAFKLFRDGKLVASDTQLSLEVQTGGKTANAVGHLIDEYQINVSENEISVRGSLGWAKQTQMTPLKLVALRLAMITIGRFFPNLMRSVLQKMLITGKKNAPFEFARSLAWENGGWRIIDELRARSWKGVTAAGIGCDQTSIHVVMSRTYQRGQLRGWLDLTNQVRKLRAGEALIVDRSL